MGYRNFDGLSAGGQADHQETIQSNGQTIELPDASFVRDADIMRDGMDLVLDGPEGTLVIKDYFAQAEAPNLVAPDGSTLTPELVELFAKNSPEYAGTATLNDESPVGSVQEVSGNATVTHADGSVETITKGTPIFQGDIIETDAQGAVNITFTDDTSFAVSQDARLAIDEYVFDPSTQSGSTDFSVLKGVFVFTSGLIGRDDPDDVKIDTPVGSIGIRGTIIAGNVDTGEITVVEGAIVLRDNNGNEVTLANQFETAKFAQNGIEHMGELSAQDVGQKFFVVSKVSPTLFSSINDTAAEQQGAQDSGTVDGTDDESAGEEAPAPVEETTPDQESSTETQQVAEEPAAPLPPPPLGTTDQTGLQTTTGGLLPPPPGDSLTAPLAPPPIINTMTTDTALAGSGDTVLPPPPPPPTDPQAIINLGGTTNPAPLNVREAPPEFFKSVEGRTWQYNFDKEFIDPGASGSTLTYQLDASTVNQLNTWNPGGAGPDFLASWSFDVNNGLLTLNFNGAFANTPGTATPLAINVMAIDAQGAGSGFHTYAFTAYNPHTTGAIATTYNLDGQVAQTTTAVSTIRGENNTIFFGAENNTITIDNDLSVNNGANNYINLGDGINTAIVMNDAYGNTVVGGFNNDVINTQNARVEAFGMDGDDEFILDLGGASSVLADLTATGSNTLIDGGHSNFGVGVQLQGLGMTNARGGGAGHGDTIVLQSVSPATLDFSTIATANRFQSIERFDLDSSGAAQTLRLNYSDVLNITDQKHTLIFNLGNGDTLNLFGMGGMNKVLDDVTINDAAEGAGVSNKTYDVFTDGNVILLIHDQGTATVTMDGSPVTI